MFWFSFDVAEYFTLLECRVFYVHKSRILIPGRLLPQKQSEGNSNNPDSKMAEEKENKDAEKVSASVVDRNHAD